MKILDRISIFRTAVITMLFAFCATTSHADDQGAYPKSDALNREALKLYRAGKLEEAIGVWQRAAGEEKLAGTNHTANAEVMNNLGYAYYRLGLQRHNQGDFAKARNYLEETIRADSSRWSVYLNLGDLYRELQKPDMALYAYQQLLRLKPGYVHADKIRATIEELARHQDSTWQTFQGTGFTLRYPPAYTTRSVSEGTEIVPPSPPKNCQPHCPSFLVVSSKGSKGLALEDWMVDQWRMEDLGRFSVFTITPQQSHWQIDCIEPELTSSGFFGYKLHRWAQAVGIRHYYFLDEKNSRVIDLQSIETGQGCNDRLAPDWTLRQVVDSLKISDLPVSHSKAIFNIYGSDEQATHTIVQSAIAVDNSRTLPEQLEQVAHAISERYFQGLPIQVKAIREQDGKNIAQIALMENEAREGAPSPKVWVNRYFEGMAGGTMTSKVLLKTFLQTGYVGKWIDGVESFYEGRPVSEEQFEHLFDLQGTHYRSRQR